jgi:glycerol-3-phosphate dehydrogenase (NAD(P)+)
MKKSGAAADVICVMGGGSWGTALARHLGLKGAAVRLWVHDAALAEEISRSRVNPAYLPGFEMPPGVVVTADIARAAEGASLAVVAIPSRYCRRSLAGASGVLPAGAPVVVASKGIEQESLLTVSGIVADVLARRPGEIAVLSGPSFASEVAAGRPTAVVAASTAEPLALRVQALFTAPSFRVYTSHDPVGVELGGALKNVIAIAAGVVEGSGMGPNTLAALVTRGLAEITRLAVALGGHPRSLAGLAGLGDLVLTCTGSLSRNRSVGQALGKGAALPAILGGMRMVAEGVDTARSARELGRREGIALPITEEVNRVLFEGKAPGDGIRELMSRPPRAESD